MALIKCPECGKEISDKAMSCPNCGLPLRREDKGTYDVIIKREKQWFLINPPIKIHVDSVEKYEIESGQQVKVPMTTGKHEILFILGPRKTVANIEVKDNMEITIKCNRVTGELEATGYGVTTSNNSPTISVGVGVGGIIGK